MLLRHARSATRAALQRRPHQIAHRCLAVYVPPPPDPELMRLLSLGELNVSKLSPEAVRSMMRL